MILKSRYAQRLREHTFMLFARRDMNKFDNLINTLRPNIGTSHIRMHRPSRTKGVLSKHNSPLIDFKDIRVSNPFNWPNELKHSTREGRLAQGIRHRYVLGFRA